MTMMKKKNTESSSSFLFSLLPEDLIIYEIFLKLPVSSLLKLRCVSKYFRSLITDPSFVNKHLDQNSSNPLLLITCRDIRPDFLKINPISGLFGIKIVFQHFSCNFRSVFDDDQQSLPEIVEIVTPFESTVGIWASCNGLLLLHGTQGESKERGYIWNPCTKECKELPCPSPSPSPSPSITSLCSKYRSSSGFCGFGYDRNNDKYKILYHENRVGHLPDDVIRSDDSLVSVTEFKLYTLGGSDTWKSISHSNPYKSLFFLRYRWKRIGLFVNGALHWIMSTVDEGSARDAKIISFDMDKETFREVPKPHYYSTRSLEEEEAEEEAEEDNYGELQVLQECLCLCQFPKSNIGTVDIWMLKDYTVKDSWTKVFTIVIPNDLSVIKYLKLLRFRENGEIVMLRDYRNHLIVYDRVNNHRSRVVENIDEFTQNRWTHEVIYTESLVSLNSGTYTI